MEDDVWVLRYDEFGLTFTSRLHAECSPSFSSPPHHLNTETVENIVTVDKMTTLTSINMS